MKKAQLERKDTQSMNMRGNEPGEVAQRIKPFATKPEDLSSIPRLYAVDGDNRLFLGYPSILHKHTAACACKALTQK